ncbi:MAG: PAS domain S-box protein [Chloroflexi bacterium]|nr:PAS domain S-box protein [Chloroflexota bacterium]
MPEKRRILYMEDDEGLGRLLQRRLGQSGYEVDLAPNGETGITLIAEHHYDAVIVDYNMPDLNGIQVLQRLSTNGPMPPTIMLTGTGNETIAVEALKLGAFDYVIKDTDAVYLDLLPTVIEQGLQSRQLVKDKQLAEQRLERSEKYYRALIENSPDLIIVTDRSGAIRYVSPAIRDIFAVDEQEFIGQNGLKLVDPDSFQFLEPAFFERAIQFYRDLVESPSRSVEIQLQVRNRMGQWKWLEIRGRNLLHEPWIESIVFNVRDITAPKLAEKALQESEERFRMLFELAPNPYVISDLEGNLLDVNQAVESLSGYQRAEMIGKSFSEIGMLDVEQVTQFKSWLSDVTVGPFSGPAEVTIIRADGENMFFDLRTIPIQSRNETQILAIGHDVTWRKLANMQLKNHIEQLETLRQIDEMLNRKLDIQYVQAIALVHMIRLSGASAGAIVLLHEQEAGHLHAQGYPAELTEEDFLGNATVARVIAKQKAEWVQEIGSEPACVPLLPDASSQMVFPLLSQKRLVGIVSLETNQPRCFYAEMFEFLKLIPARAAVAIDNARLFETRQAQLIELQDLYEKIRQLEQLKTDMIRLAAHDLRNPLSVIGMNAFVLRKKNADELQPEQQRQIEEIEAAVKRMQTMIADFLSVERIEAITLNAFDGQEVDLSELAQNVFSTFEAQARAKSQTFCLAVPPLPVTVVGFRNELQQAIVNIVGNAIKYSPEGARIDVILKMQDDTARLEVVDTGYGISAEQQDKLFRPFYRARSAETETIEGTGLGLYLVKRMIERNGGQIIFSSEYGRGSVFGFCLPVAQK